MPALGARLGPPFSPRLRLRGRGSSGGHRGLDSLIERWGTDGFPRLRIGIGRPAGDAAAHVLAPFGEDELDTLRRIVDAAADAVRDYLDRGLDPAMSRINPLRIAASDDVDPRTTV